MTSQCYLFEQIKSNCIVLEKVAMGNPARISPLSEVLTKSIGSGTRIWQYVVVLEGAVIGADCNICAHCFVEDDVVIGDRVTVKNGVQLWNGVTLEDDVFIGPNVTFTNDKYPVSGKNRDRYEKIFVAKRASVGGGSVLLPGIKIGQSALVGAGSVVTRSVPDFAIVLGNPARVVGDVRVQR